jgi:argininosuccinate lyase
VLVGRGVPFREAHGVVGRLVGDCVSKRLDPRTLSLEELRAFHPAFPAAAADLVGLERSIEARDLPGGPARRRVLAALDETEARLRAAQRALGPGGGEADL